MKEHLEFVKKVREAMKHGRINWKRIRSIVSFVLVFIVTYTMILPGITLEGSQVPNMAGLRLAPSGADVLACHFSVHKHTDECYRDQPVYDADGNLRSRILTDSTKCRKSHRNISYGACFLCKTRIIT